MMEAISITAAQMTMCTDPKQRTEFATFVFFILYACMQRGGRLMSEFD